MFASLGLVRTPTSSAFYVAEAKAYLHRLDSLGRPLLPIEDFALDEILRGLLREIEQQADEEACLRDTREEYRTAILDVKRALDQGDVGEARDILNYFIEWNLT